MWQFIVDFVQGHPRLGMVLIASLGGGLLRAIFFIREMIHKNRFLLHLLAAPAPTPTTITLRETTTVFAIPSTVTAISTSTVTAAPSTVIATSTAYITVTPTPTPSTAPSPTAPASSFTAIEAMPIWFTAVAACALIYVGYRFFAGPGHRVTVPKVAAELPVVVEDEARHPPTAPGLASSTASRAEPVDDPESSWLASYPHLPDVLVDEAYVGDKNMAQHDEPTTPAATRVVQDPIPSTPLLPLPAREEGPLDSLQILAARARSVCGSDASASSSHTGMCPSNSLMTIDELGPRREMSDTPDAGAGRGKENVAVGFVPKAQVDKTALARRQCELAQHGTPVPLAKKSVIEYEKGAIDN
ncbi:hypothetical protein FB45DRAFT_168724 [Roridomyces roridus]|uniref:Transmembrane protein n=1 Tax=Roridomyces roridus TaxID=1738132 RepID=A0AAD7BE93_9AGAR|nr:hypothetical protein FB45DRAFT_168724 [Roridomyces roridus]